MMHNIILYERSVATYLAYLLTYTYTLYILPGKGDGSAAFHDKLITLEDVEVEFASTTDKIKQVVCSSTVNVTSVVE